MPLVKPYVLSFCTVKEVDSIVVRFHMDDGRSGFAEVVPLPGYSHETRESILHDLQRILPKLIGLDAESLFIKASAWLASSPFALSALVTALEVATGQVVFPDRLEVPLLSAVSASRDARKVLDAALDAVEQGFKTIKVKVGKDIEADTRSARLLLDELPRGVSLRFDANQAYTYEEASTFCRVLDHPRNSLVELLEQPFGVHEDGWRMFEKLTGEMSHVPMMLDESIVSSDDIERAANVGAAFVKLKLFKHRGLREVLALAQRATELEMRTVLGNGVSTEIGNILEGIAFITSGLFYGASEGNGFAKLSQRVVSPSVQLQRGRMVWRSAGEGREPWSLDNSLYRMVDRG